MGYSTFYIFFFGRWNCKYDLTVTRDGIVHASCIELGETQVSLLLLHEEETGQ